MSNADNELDGPNQAPPPVGASHQEGGRRAVPVRHHHIADWLREQIESEAMPPGTLVPTPRELAKTFGVADSTARRALEVLRYEGMIDERHWPLARVRQCRPRYRRVVSRNYRRDPSVWRTVELNRLTETRHVRVADEMVPDCVARVLRIPKSTVVSVHRSLAVVYGRPVQLTTTYRPSNAPASSERDLMRVREELHLRMPGSAERDRLCLSFGVPVAEITKTVYQTTHPIEFSTSVIDGSSCLLEYDYFVIGSDHLPS